MLWHEAHVLMEPIRCSQVRLPSTMNERSRWNFKSDKSFALHSQKAVKCMVYLSLDINSNIGKNLTPLFVKLGILPRYSFPFEFPKRYLFSFTFYKKYIKYVLDRLLMHVLRMRWYSRNVCLGTIWHIGRFHPFASSPFLFNIYSVSSTFATMKHITPSMLLFKLYY